MPHIIRAQGKVLKKSKGKLIHGGAVVVLDKIPSVKEPIVETKFTKEFKGSGTKVLKSNLVALPNNRRSAELQRADLRTGENATTVQPMFRESSSSSGKGLIPNSIKIPLSLRKKEKRNNIKLVL